MIQQEKTEVHRTVSPQGSTTTNHENTRRRQRHYSANEQHEAYLARRRTRYQIRRSESINTTDEIVSNNASRNRIQPADEEGDKIYNTICNFCLHSLVCNSI